ncbi:hypothetical protein SEEPB962_22822 [Salmonella enterica subsp. enterica serovar Paratyphi B str. ATCC 51962]|nr:hypothetical protein SEEPB962_22822 [Salmonella enterica subsp. enterica serovar Paratyphi B str. ATCC 51962]
MILFSNIMLDIFFQKKPNKFFVLMKLFATKTIVKFTAGLESGYYGTKTDIINIETGDVDFEKTKITPK